MLVPPKSVASAERCNPEGISSFYMASNEETAIKEIRIWYNDDITLAEIEINNNFYIWNFNFYEYENLGVLLRRNLNLETRYLIEILNEELSLEEDKLISKTVLCNSDNKRKLAYIPFQFISEYVKSRGIDGFFYRSSLNQNGQNYVIFNHECNPNIKIWNENN